MSVWWSWGLAVIGLLGIYLAGRKLAIGWLVGVAAQVPWLAYAVVTRQWGFVVTAVAYAGFYGRNWLRWRREARSEIRPASNLRHAAAYSGGTHIIGVSMQPGYCPPSASMNPDATVRRASPKTVID